MHVMISRSERPTAHGPWQAFPYNTIQLLRSVHGDISSEENGNQAGRPPAAKSQRGILAKYSFQIWRIEEPHVFLV